MVIKKSAVVKKQTKHTENISYQRKTSERSSAGVYLNCKYNNVYRLIIN
jgi:hypothetical protein